MNHKIGAEAMTPLAVEGRVHCEEASAAAPMEPRGACPAWLVLIVFLALSTGPIPSRASASRAGTAISGKILDMYGAGKIPIQKRVPSRAAQREFGVHLVDFRQGEPTEVAAHILGPAPVVWSGDASTSLAQVCYVSNTARDRTYLLVEQGEVDGDFYLLRNPSPWRDGSRCTRVASLNAALEKTEHVKLGMTRAGVEQLLGKPSLIRKHELDYHFSLMVKNSPRELARVRKANPAMSEADIEANYDSYYLEAYFIIGFRYGRSNFLHVVWTTQY